MRHRDLPQPPRCEPVSRRAVVYADRGACARLTSGVFWAGWAQSSSLRTARRTPCPTRGPSPQRRRPCSLSCTARGNELPSKDDAADVHWWAPVGLSTAGQRFNRGSVSGQGHELADLGARAEQSVPARPVSHSGQERLKTSEGFSVYTRHARARDVYNQESLQRSSEGAFGWRTSACFFKPLRRDCGSPCWPAVLRFLHEAAIDQGFRQGLCAARLAVAGSRTTPSTRRTARWCG